MTKIQTAHIAIALMALSGCGDTNHLVAEEDVNYCHDKDTEAEWQDLSAKFPKEDNIQVLHALRIGLCEKIEQGTVELNHATHLFERFREIVVKEGERQKQEAEPVI